MEDNTENSGIELTGSIKEKVEQFVNLLKDNNLSLSVEQLAALAPSSKEFFIQCGNEYMKDCDVEEKCYNHTITCLKEMYEASLHSLSSENIPQDMKKELVGRLARIEDHIVDMGKTRQEKGDKRRNRILKWGGCIAAGLLLMGGMASSVWISKKRSTDEGKKSEESSGSDGNDDNITTK